MDPAKGVMVMTSILWRMNQLADAPGPTWETIYCSRKVAYGCGEHGQKAVEGLTLFRSRAEHQDLTSSMTIRLSAEAIGSIKADLGLVPRSELEAEGFVKFASEGLLVLVVKFFEVFDSTRLGYYLVYDSTDASLYMTPSCLPSRLEPSYTTAPVPRRIDGGGSEPQLVLMAHSYRPHGLGREEFLCLCTPAASPGITDQPWDIKVLCFPRLAGSFHVDGTFSFQGKLFWADLSQGLAYCDLRAAGDSSTVELDFIKLPCGYEILYYDLAQDELIEPAEMNRTIGCIGGRIKFICIDRSQGHSGNTMLRFWTLDLGCKKWRAEEEGLLWKELWEPIDFMGDAGLRDVEPLYPVLMPDGTLCLVLRDMRPRGGSPADSVEVDPVDDVEVDRICRFDIFSKTPLWHGNVCDYMRPVILPGDLFTKCNPPPNPRMTKLQSIVARLFFKA